jgi:hypothetical protein
LLKTSLRRIPPGINNLKDWIPGAKERGIEIIATRRKQRFEL